MNITLIGMAGVGKSSIGEALAKKLEYQFIDTDPLIEEAHDMPLPAIIERYGEQGFLIAEQKVVMSLKVTDNTVIAPGGSVIYSLESMAYLKDISTVIFLSASFEAIAAWIASAPDRSIIGLADRGLSRVYEERQWRYVKYADITVELEQDYQIEPVVEYIANLIKNSE